MPVISRGTRNLPGSRFKSFTGKRDARAIARNRVVMEPAGWPMARLPVDIETTSIAVPGDTDWEFIDIQDRILR